MSELPMPTRGPVIVDERDIHDERRYILTEIGGQPYVVAQVGLARSPDIRAMQEADADLIAAAFNAAEEARKMGFDPIGCIQALPKLLADAESLCRIADATGHGDLFPAIRTDLAAARTRQATP
jgi:hypothetical protein